jgi:2-polyprenyl-3-methyl-5-hydroxy-6-metoxy-1,4-benzoquinol methylase
MTSKKVDMAEVGLADLSIFSVEVRMTTRWMDMTNISFNTLLLLERVQLSWFPGWVNEDDLGLALKANPVVEWYLRHKCPQITDWLNKAMGRAEGRPLDPQAVKQAEVHVLQSLDDLITYVHDPSIYDGQEFLNWDSKELTSLVDFSDKIVIDVGAGTGRLTFVAAQAAKAVFAVEPVANLRYYIKEKARKRRVNNVFPVDGLITDLPFPDTFAHVTMGGHVFGDDPATELAELERVTQPEGMVILCPGNNDVDNDRHVLLMSRGFHWKPFLEPPTDKVRKYWKKV